MPGTDIVGVVGVDIIPITATFHQQARAQILPGADKLGDELGAAIARTMSARIAAAIPKAVSDGARAAKADAVKQGSSTGGSFADSLRAKLEAAFRAMPKLDIKLSDTGVDAELARLRAKLESLSSKRIGIDLSVSDAEAKIQDIDDRLARLGASSPNVRVQVDVATARAALADFQAEIRAASADPLTIPVRIGSFESDLVARVEAAQASLPVIEIGADTDRASLALDRIRAELAAIPTRLKVDVDFNVTEALAKIAELRAELKVLTAGSADINVRVDAARAETELAAISAEVDALKAERINLDVDTGSARSSVLLLAAALASLAAPAIPAIIAGAGGIASAFTAAAAGVGALTLAALPGLKDVSAAMQAKTAATNADTKATANNGNAAATAAQQALQMAGAQQSLVSAERSAASSIRSADEQVANSKRAVATAVQNAADQQTQALQQVQTAEKNLTQAQKTEKSAQASLTQARITAAQQLSDLQDQLRDGALDERSAALAVVHARNDLANAVANQQSDPLGYADAQLAYQQAMQAQREQKTSYDRLKTSAAQQQAAGVGGNSVVQQAAQQLADAQADVAAKTQAVADAQANVAKTAKSSAQAIKDAQRSEANAYLAAADARANAADSIASAERSIESARLSTSKSTTTATTQEDAYRKALEKLTPSARQLYDAIAGPAGLKSAFTAWSQSLQLDVLPIFTRGVNSAKATLPGLTPLVLAAADGVTELYDKASKELKTPFWGEFKDTIDNSAKPSIVGLGVAFGNVFKGMAGIVDAFLGHIDGVDSAMIRITGRFANWGVNLKGSEGFQRFLDYVNTQGPKAAHYIGQIMSTILDVARDIQPVTEGFFGPLLSGVSWLAENMPEVVKYFWALYLASKAWALTMAAVNIAVGIYEGIMAIADLETVSFAAALASTGLSEIILAIEAAVVLLGLALYELWTRAGWFRNGVVAAWRGIQTAVLAVWTYALKPVIDAFSVGLHAIGVAAAWLWTTALLPTFNAIQIGARYLITFLLTVLITPFYIAITQVLAPIALWLWKNAISPAFHGIAELATWLWKNALHPVFSAIGSYLKTVYDTVLKPLFSGFKTLMKETGDAANYLWKHALKPAFDGIASLAHTLWVKGLKPEFDLIKTGVGQIASSFGTAKDGIKKSWDQLSGIASKPVKFIVDHVYNQGIMPVWNGVAKVTGVKPLSKVDTSKWATGGVLPGYSPGQDPHKFTSPTGGRLELSGGEAILRPEVTRVLGAPFVYAINTIAQRGGIGGVRRAIGGAYSGGGILGSIGDVIGSATSGAYGLAKSATSTVKDLASYAANPTKIWDALTKKIKSELESVGTTDWAQMLAKLPLKAVDSLKAKAVDSVKDILPGGGPSSFGGALSTPGSGVNRWAGVVGQALKLVGQPSSLMGITLKRMNQESGGNPTIVNRWDANWLAGHPSVGLMQLIAGTFKHYAGPFAKTGPFEYGVSVDPLANVYASMRYALSRYGSLQSAYGRAGGYDNGGFLQPGDTLVHNRTGEPEAVLNPSQWSAIRANLDARNSASNVNADVRVFVGDREITDIVRTELDVHDSESAMALSYGRKF